MTGLRILLVEDEQHNRDALAEMLRRLGHEVETASDGQEALERLSKVAFDFVLSDVRMPRMDGLQLFDACQKISFEHGRIPPFAFVTAYGRLDEAVSAMRLGAVHFLTKPIKKKDLQMVLDDVVKMRAHIAVPKEKATNIPAEKESSTRSPVFVSRAFGDVVQMVDRVAASQASVLLVGESGTGKEVMARRLHDRSARAMGPFVAFHAAAMPETLLESALFGHEKGAFTGAFESKLGQIRAAHGGTFFLDEISSMPYSTQTKLLRVIQDRTILPLGSTTPIECDVRWVAATNIPLESLVAKGLFREDLLYRLQVVSVELPPLRERPEDVEVLARHFLETVSAREGKPTPLLPRDVLDLLEAYPWPGNVRELQNVLERAMALIDGEALTKALLPEHIAGSAKSREIRVAVGSSLQTVEDKLIEETLKSCNGDKVQAAAILGVAPRTIYRWLEKRQSSTSVS